MKEKVASRHLKGHGRVWTGVQFKVLLLAGMVVALGVAPSASFARARPRSGPVPVVAQASLLDCDGDGDPADTLDPLECGSSLQQPEPGKLYSKGEKQKFAETADEYLRAHNKICGASGGVFATRYVALIPVFGFAVHFGLLCIALASQHAQYEALAEDPPDQAVFEVALPKPPKAARAPSAAGRRYLAAVAQKAAFGGALATSLNRLSSTPPEPEEITASPVPKYSRRLQAGAGRLYSGLVAAWAERESSARASVLALVRRQGAAARRRVAALLPKSAHTKALWAAFKSLTAPEYAQLTADLYQQVIEAQFLKNFKKIAAKARSSPLQASKEFAALQKVQESARTRQTALYADLGALLESSESSSSNLGPLATATIKAAAKLPKVRGLAKYAPQAGLMARLVSFAGAAFLPGKPKPFPAG